MSDWQALWRNPEWWRFVTRRWWERREGKVVMKGWIERNEYWLAWIPLLVLGFGLLALVLWTKP